MARWSDEQHRETLDVWEKCGRSAVRAADVVGVSASTMRDRVQSAKRRLNYKESPEATEDLASTAHDREVKRLKADRDAWKSKYEAALEEIGEWEARVEVSELLGDSRPRKISRPKRGQSGGTTAILILTDWHAEEDIDPAKCNELNEFNPTICEKRVRVAVTKGLELINAWRQTWPVDELYVPLLGDLIAGYIHEELQESNHLSPTESILLVEQLVVDALDFLKQESGVDRIIVPTCYGNHGRTTPKRRIKTAAENSYEWLLYHQLSRVYRNDPAIEFRVTSGYHNIQEIRGRDVRFHHGDAIRYGGGVGGISIPVNKAIAAWNKSRRCDYDFFGHYHQYLDDWRWTSCPCLCGYNDFSVNIKAEYQPPAQLLALLNKSHGKLAALPVFLD